MKILIMPFSLSNTMQYVVNSEHYQSLNRYSFFITFWLNIEHLLPNNLCLRIFRYIFIPISFSLEVIYFNCAIKYTDVLPNFHRHFNVEEDQVTDINSTWLSQKVCLCFTKLPQICWTKNFSLFIFESVSRLT